MPRRPPQGDPTVAVVRHRAADRTASSALEVKPGDEPAPANRSATDHARGIPDPLAPAVHAALAAWFAEQGRDLPWRRTRDPWAILVAEVMLQQVQVARAIPFWEAFLVRFPTATALAEAPLADAIRVWGDLGRYRRVVNLHRTARLLVEQHGGAVPADPAILATLPGIGSYTAGAVACFAFERDEAFLDTNIRRVLHRLFVGPESGEGSARAKEVDAIARRVLPVGDGWVWNQALMDLGATVCTARKPACNRCPVAVMCRARAGIAAALQTKEAARKERGRPAYRYEGSDRFYRGRVLAELRALPPEPDAAIPLAALGSGIRADFVDGHLPWLRGVVASLERDGLVVAEDRPTWDAAGDPTQGEVVVRLPGSEQ
jgi:A/G-specific adenine glycosylase